MAENVGEILPWEIGLLRTPRTGCLWGESGHRYSLLLMHSGGRPSAPTAILNGRAAHQAVSSRTSPVEESQARRDTNLSPTIRPDCDGGWMSKEKGGGQGSGGRLPGRQGGIASSSTSALKAVLSCTAE
jgi:hypothetical protein